MTTEEIPWENRFTSPQEARYSERYFEAKGFAWFRCQEDGKCWPSAHAWCFIDLKKQRICYRYKQNCKKCEFRTKPGFTESAVTRMARFVVEKYLIRIGELEILPVSGNDGTMTKGGPHDQDRCGKCKALGRSCWN